MLAVSMPMTTVNAEEQASDEQIYEAESEVQDNMDLENLESNSEKEINELSEEGQEFYRAIEIDGLETYEENFEMENANNGEYSTQVIGISSKEYTLTPGDISAINSVATGGATGTALANALAKHFGKSPTPTTLVVAAIGGLGVGGINSCDQGNGVIITKTQFGTGPATYSCEAR
ncbi:hypothetical protein [Marinococcus halophilus]|uniref:hypothetical protein n=1 Tax=Marinococcus halophilus TaxID=1371 RepID=UPI0009A71A17|nr:hypothetical protein [Marinococcus halophilus]